MLRTVHHSGSISDLLTAVSVFLLCFLLNLSAVSVLCYLRKQINSTGHTYIVVNIFVY